MMLLFLFAELAFLYLLSRWLTKTLFDCFFLLFRSRTVALMIMLVLTFPGTVVHELSHLFTAAILGVHTGKLTLEPTGIHADEIRTGSVAIAETDPFRRYAIGLAPVVGGIIILTAIAYFLPQRSVDWTTWVLGYLLFSVSNSMFSSPQDLKGFLPFAVTLGIFIGAFYYLGLRIAITGEALDLVSRILTTLVKSLGVVLGINAILLLISLTLTNLLMRIFHVRIRKS